MKICKSLLFIRQFFLFLHLRSVLWGGIFLFLESRPVKLSGNFYILCPWYCIWSRQQRRVWNCTRIRSIQILAPELCNRSLNCYLVFTTSVPQNYCVLTRFRLHKMISSPISSGSTKWVRRPSAPAPQNDFVSHQLRLHKIISSPVSSGSTK